MFTESCFKYISRPFWEKRNNQAVGRLDGDLVLKTIFGRPEREIVRKHLFSIGYTDSYINSQISICLIE